MARCGETWTDEDGTVQCDRDHGHESTHSADYPNGNWIVWTDK